MDAFGLGNRPEAPIEKGGMDVDLSHVVRSHFACMYLCFLHGPKCIFFSFMHFFAAKHKIFTTEFNLSTFPTNTSGNLWTSWLYSSLALAISNSARKFNSIITLTSPLLELELSITSMKVCSPALYWKTETSIVSFYINYLQRQWRGLATDFLMKDMDVGLTTWRDAWRAFPFSLADSTVITGIPKTARDFCHQATPAGGGHWSTTTTDGSSHLYFLQRFFADTSNPWLQGAGPEQGSLDTTIHNRN